MLKKGRIAALLILSVLLIISTGCSKQQNEKTSSQPEKITMRIAIATDEGGLGHQQVKIFKKKIEEKLPGLFEIKIFAGSKLGTGTENVQSLMSGDLEASLLGSEGISVDTKLGIFEIPWMFNGFDEFEEVTSGPLFGEIQKTFEEHNLKLVAIYGSGFRDILAKKPINNLLELEGLKTRVAPSPERLKVYKLLNAVPVTVQWADTYLALEQGTVEAVEAYPVYLKSGKMYEQAKYLADINYISAPFFMTFSNKFWNSLEPDVQKKVIQAGKESIEEANQLAREIEDQDLEYMKNQGVEVISTDLKGYKELRLKVSENYMNENGKDWLKLTGVIE